jgi:NAD(P)-dependent dehydrogenase (short-subunit alcohol dehydrogenase family)
MPQKIDNHLGSLEGRVIVVTGASSGVGYAAARRLAQQEGARVAAVGRRRMFRIEALARQIAEQFGEERLLTVTADMAAPGEAQALAERIVEKYGRVDGFLHAVNRSLRLTALEVNDQEFDMTMQVNVKSALYGVQALTPILRRQRSGGIVIYNPTPTPTPIFAASEAVYAAAAQALSALSGGWRRQLEPHGVRVREVAPMPLGESLSGDVSAHDEMVLNALRETILAPALETLTLDSALNSPPLEMPSAPDRRQPWAANGPRPIVLSRLGGLALTQFSQI